MRPGWTGVDLTEAGPRKATLTANLVNNVIVGLIFLLTVVNVFIAAFGLNNNIPPPLFKDQPA